MCVIYASSNCIYCVQGEADGHAQPEEVALNMQNAEDEAAAEKNLYLYEVNF